MSGVGVIAWLGLLITDVVHYLVFSLSRNLYICSDKIAVSILHTNMFLKLFAYTVSRKDDINLLPGRISCQLFVDKILELLVKSCHEFCPRSYGVRVKPLLLGQDGSFSNSL